MRRLCLSRQFYVRLDSERSDFVYAHSQPMPTAACGGRQDDLGRIPVLRRGQGLGLVPKSAISVEAHCPACVRVLLGTEHVDNAQRDLAEHMWPGPGQGED